MDVTVVHQQCSCALCVSATPRGGQRTLPPNDAKVFVLSLSDCQYNLIKRYAEDDRQSMNAWIEALVDIEDMRLLHAVYVQ